MDANVTSLNLTDCGTPARDESMGDPIGDDSGFIFGLAAILAGMLTRSLSRVLAKTLWCPPYTVMMFVIGVMFERWSDSMPSILSHSIAGWKDTHPHFILFILVPPLLFESSFNVDWGAFRTQMTSSIVLAGPGVIFSTGATAVCILPIIRSLNSAFTAEFAFLLAAIVTATDPVAVVAVLRELGAPPRLSMLVEGESLLNDGSAVMLFLVFLELVEDPDKDHTNLTVVGMGKEFSVVAGVAVLWGFGIGYVTYQWMRAFDDATVDITSLIIGVFTTFYVAEHIMHVSGILALVVYGLFLARNKGFCMDRHEMEENEGVWEEAAFLSNTFIFVLAGLIISDRVNADNTLDSSWYMYTSVVLYLICSLVRICMLAGGFPLLHYLGYGMTMKEAVMMSFSGLRGAISLALALLVEQSDKVAGVVTLSLLINGSMAGILYKYLHVYETNPSMKVIQKLAVKKLASEYEEDIVSPIRSHWLHQKADFAVVEQLIPDLTTMMVKDMGQGEEDRVKWDFVPIETAWQEHMIAYNNMTEGEIEEQLQRSTFAKGDEVSLFIQERTNGDAGSDNPKAPGVEMHAVDEKVTPAALRGFHFDLALFDEDGDGNEDSEEESLAAIYTVLINAVAASFDTERFQHLISRDCFSNLRLCLESSLDMLTKGISIDDQPLIEFMDEVKRWIHNGRTGLHMSHHVFDHLLMSTEMLYGVITSFRDLGLVAQKINMPSKFQHHRDRFSDNIETVVQSAFKQLDDLYHDHSRLMVTVHTNLAARHIFKGFIHLIHMYTDAGLLSSVFREDTDHQLSKQLETIEQFFDANPMKRMQYSLIERWNIIVRNNKASDVHPMVDRQVFKDERKSSGEQLKALNHSVWRAFFTFLNPFARTQIVYLERVAGLGAKGAADDVNPDVKMVNPIVAMDADSPED